MRYVFLAPVSACLESLISPAWVPLSPSAYSLSTTKFFPFEVPNRDLGFPRPQHKLTFALTPTRSEIVHIQGGQCGNQIGAKFWEVQ